MHDFPTFVKIQLKKNMIIFLLKTNAFLLGEVWGCWTGQSILFYACPRRRIFLWCGHQIKEWQRGSEISWNIWYLLKPIKNLVQQQSTTTLIRSSWCYVKFLIIFVIHTFFKIRSYAVQLPGKNFLFQFKLHSILLNLAVPGHDWRLSPLNGMPDNILSTVFHYLYKECLPPGLSEDTARDCIKTLADMKEFDTFTNLCQTFLRNTALRHR